MKMLRGLVVLASIAVGVNVVKDVQESPAQVQLKPTGKLSALETWSVQGMDHLRSSWHSLWNPFETEPEGAINHALEEDVVTTKGMPSKRKQMYFRPVSVTLQCVMTLTIASLIIYTFLSISRNADELNATFSPSTPTQMLTIASRVSSFAPMMCMLFVACRMFVLATTEGLGEPPLWVKKCMWLSVYGVGIQIAVVLMLPSFTKKVAADEASYDMTEGKMDEYKASHPMPETDDTAEPTEDEKAKDLEHGAKEHVTDLTGEQNDVHPDLNRVEFRKDSLAMQYPFYIMQVVSALMIYVGVVGVIVGIMTFPTQTTKMSVAVFCTVLLSGLYFSGCLLLWVARGVAEPEASITNAALAITSTIRKIPMFAVLFLASRMRALQLDPPYGMPPFWMQCCFYGITAFTYLEAVIGAYIGLTAEEKIKGYYGVYIFKHASKALQMLVHLCAFVAVGLLIPVVIGVFAMENKSGEPAPLSTTLQCTIVLEAVYFGVVFVQELVLLAEKFYETHFPMLRDTAIAAGISLGLSPLLCILFVATRMRALQITQQMGAPPGWAQDCMLIAVFAVCVQALCCLLMPIFVGGATKVDEDGNPDYDLQPMVGAYAVAVVKYVALFALHGSVITVCVSVYAMTPETANSNGRFLNNTKSLIEGIAVTLLVFGIALLFSSAKVIGMAIKFAIEAADQELIGCDITVKKCALSLFKGYVHIQRLVVHQPEFEMIYEKNAEGKLEGKYVDAEGKPIPLDSAEEDRKKCVWKHDYIAKIDLILLKIDVGTILQTLGKKFVLENLSLKGVHVNVEKPDTDTSKHNANIEYITQKLDSLGLIPPPEEAPAKEEPKKEEKKPEPKKEEPKKEEEKPADVDIPTIILHKIVLGDIGAGVVVRGVPMIGEISFHPSIGLIEFDDIQNDIFGGREDLAPGEVVACLISAMARKVFKKVVQDIPTAVKNAVKDGAKRAASGLADSANLALKKLPCTA